MSEAGTRAQSRTDELEPIDTGRGRPLSGRRILVTRSAEQAEQMMTALCRLGATALACPTITILAPSDYSELDAAQDDLGSFDFLILTSVNAVRAFFTRLDQSGQDARALADLCVVAVGPKTAEHMEEYGIKADLVPADYRAEGVVDLLRDRVAAKRVLYPRAALARDLIVTQLTAAGADVVAPTAYASGPPAEAGPTLRRALDGGVDLLTFTASSTVRNFVRLLDADTLARARKIPAASIGPLTTRTCRELGFDVVIEPAESTLDGLLQAIVAHAQGPRGQENETR